MKVLHVIDSGGLYGAENVLLNCVEEQMKIGCQPVICSIGDLEVKDKPLEVEAQRRGFPIVKFRMRPGLNVAGALRIVAYARRNSFDIIHSHGYKGNVLFGLMPRYLRRIPVISTLHGWTSQHRTGRMALYQWLDRRALRLVDHVVVVSESMLRLHPIRKLKRVSVIRNGIDLTDSTRVPRKSKVSAKEILIGAAGRLSAEKGFNFLIESLYIVRQAGVNARLIVIGEGAEREPLEQLIRKQGLADFVQLPGYRTDIQRFLQEIDVFVVSSLTEGAPMSVLEAMRGGTPVVATAVGGIPEMLDDGRAGILVKPGDVAELANAIKCACTNYAETGARTRRAYDRVKERYDRKIMTKLYCRLYANIVGRWTSEMPLKNDSRGRCGTSHDVT